MGLLNVVLGMMINKVCGLGLKVVMLVVNVIVVGDVEIVIVGG